MNTIIKLTNVGFYGSGKNRVEIELEEDQYIFYQEIWDMIKKYAGIIGMSPSCRSIKRYLWDTKFVLYSSETLWRHKVNDDIRGKDWEFEISRYGESKYPDIVLCDLVISFHNDMDNKVSGHRNQYQVNRLQGMLKECHTECYLCKKKQYQIKLPGPSGQNWKIEWGGAFNVCNECWSQDE